MKATIGKSIVVAVLGVLLVPSVCSQSKRPSKNGKGAGSIAPASQSIQATGQTAPKQGLTQSTPEQKRLEMPLEEQYLLQKLRMQQELQDEILKWAQTRFWIVALISVLLGIFGVRAIVREMLASELKDAMRASADAQAAATQSREVTREVRAEGAKYKELVEKLSATAETLDSKLKELQSRIEAEGSHAVATAELKIAALAQQVTELSELVKGFATDSKEARQTLKEYEQKLAALRESAATTNAEFVENSRFRVVVVHHGDGFPTERVAREIVRALSERGFKASEGKWAEGTPVHDHVDINFAQNKREKAELVGGIVQRVLKEQAYTVKSVSFSEATKMSGNEIILFL